MFTGIYALGSNGTPNDKSRREHAQLMVDASSGRLSQLPAAAERGRGAQHDRSLHPPREAMSNRPDSSGADLPSRTSISATGTAVLVEAELKARAPPAHVRSASYVDNSLANTGIGRPLRPRPRRTSCSSISFDIPRGRHVSFADEQPKRLAGSESGRASAQSSESPTGSVISLSDGISSVELGDEDHSTRREASECSSGGRGEGWVPATPRPQTLVVHHSRQSSIVEEPESPASCHSHISGTSNGTAVCSVGEAASLGIPSTAASSNTHPSSDEEEIPAGKGAAGRQLPGLQPQTPRAKEQRLPAGLSQRQYQTLMFIQKVFREVQPSSFESPAAALRWLEGLHDDASRSLALWHVYAQTFLKQLEERQHTTGRALVAAEKVALFKVLEAAHTALVGGSRMEEQQQQLREEEQAHARATLRAAAGFDPKHAQAVRSQWARVTANQEARGVVRTCLHCSRAVFNGALPCRGCGSVWFCGSTCMQAAAGGHAGVCRVLAASAQGRKITAPVASGWMSAEL